MTSQRHEQPTSRPRGRPRLDISPDAVANAVAELFAEGGMEAVSVLDTAEKLSVSRATLYRMVPTKEDLLGLLFERSTSELTQMAHDALEGTDDPGEQLLALVRIQVDAAIRMRRYLPVFFGGGELPPEVVKRWQRWTRTYEALWVDVVRDNMAAGILPQADPAISARLILGSLIWVSRWYRPGDKFDPQEIVDTALAMVAALQVGRKEKQKRSR